MPRMVSARPVATWLTASPSVISAKISDISDAGGDAAQRADDDRAGEPGAAKAAGRAHDHHALDAEVEHAGAFGHEFAGRSQQQRRGGREHRKDDGLNAAPLDTFGDAKIELERGRG